MKFGVVFPQTQIPDDPVAIRNYAQGVEAAGFDYLLAYDHVLGVNPAERPDWDPFGIVEAGGDPSGKRATYDYQSRFQEPMVLHAFLAGVTSTIELATGVVVLPQRQTALVAKQAANVANLSGGRLRLGVGVGWNDAEYEALGQDFKTRGRRMEEQVAQLRRFWSEDTVTFDGEFERVRGAGINPRPKAPIPLWLGGNSAIAMRRAARLADGWQPGIDASEAAESARQFREHVEAAGRDPEKVGLENVIQCGETVDEGVLTVQEAAETADVFREAGFSHVVISTLDAGHESMEDHLEFATQWLAMVRN